MFGFKPKHEDLTGQPAKSEDDKLYGRYGKMIEDKLEKLEQFEKKEVTYEDWIKECEQVFARDEAIDWTKFIVEKLLEAGLIQRKN